MSSASKSGSKVLLAPAIAFIVLLFLYPFAYGLYLSFTKADGGATFANYLRFFKDPWDLRTIWTTLWISVPITFVNVGLAIPFAYHMRTGNAGRKER